MGLSVEEKTETTDPSTGDRFVTRTIKDGSGNVASRTRTRYHAFPWGERVIEHVNDPGDAGLTTTTTYYEDPAMTGSYGRIKSVAHPDGSWNTYAYDASGRVSMESRPWLDTHFPYG